ncbi:MAG TPA: murein L,D-transpeptidase, partial [Bradyrhizobium sp.]|nr:murein L,D-transpeptidase [Bradyrhizobium sp.]
MTLIAIATMLATASAFAQGAGTAGTDVADAAPHPAKPVKPAAASTPESRSAAALALSHEPTFDEG